MKRLFKLLTLTFAVMLLTLPTDAAVKQKKSKKGDVVRLIDYNIMNGMWYDQYNNYDRFVKWVSEQHPDVFAICEGASNWDANRKSTKRDAGPRFLPDSLQQLAVRWGHKFVAVGPYQDNYPVAFTSRYPIEVVQRIGGDAVSHGALHVKINGVNYVVLHLWPQRYSMGDKTKKDNGGDAFRVKEMQYILDATILNPKYKGEKHWMMMGDFNSVSPVDDFKYNGSRFLGVHELIRKAYAHDPIAEMHPGAFIASEQNDRVRIDFIYCTEAIMKGMKAAEIIKDDFTLVASDHRPVMVEFAAPKK